jgi:hypothetical protein
VKPEATEYRDGDLTLKGFFTFDDRKAGKRPGVPANPEGSGWDLWRAPQPTRSYLGFCGRQLLQLTLLRLHHEYSLMDQAA